MTFLLTFFRPQAAEKVAGKEPPSLTVAGTLSTTAEIDTKPTQKLVLNIHAAAISIEPSPPLAAPANHPCKPTIPIISYDDYSQREEDRRHDASDSAGTDSAVFPWRDAHETLEAAVPGKQVPRKRLVKSASGKYKDTDNSTIEHTKKTTIPTVPTGVSVPESEIEKEKEKEVDFEAPKWFLENCVETAEELQKHRVPLLIRRHDERNGQTPSSPTEDGSDDIYEIHAVVYAPLTDLSVPVPSSQGLQNGNGHTHFKTDIVYLRYPYPKPKPYSYSSPFVNPAPPPSANPYSPMPAMPPQYTSPTAPFPGSSNLNENQRGTTRFLRTVVEHFARDSGAALITLALDDVLDLVGHFAKRQGIKQDGLAASHSNGLARKYFNIGNHPPPPNPGLLSPPAPPKPFNPPPMYAGSGKQRTSLKPQATRPQFPFKAILSSPMQKRKAQCSSNSITAPTAIVIHLPEIQNLLRSTGNGLLEQLRSAMNKLHHDHSSMMIIATSSEYVEVPASSISPSTKPLSTPIIIAPASTPDQISLFKKDQKAEMDFELQNIRRLQYALRQSADQAEDILILQPYASRKFLQGNKISTLLVERRMTDDEIGRIAQGFKGQSDAAQIHSKILEIGQRQERLELWSSAIQEKKEEAGGKWSAFPAHVQAAIKKIECQPHMYPWESQFLSLLVNPQDIEQGWADIEIGGDVKETITQLVSQLFTSKKTSYGILRHARITGALLYGPPGTGKTALARIIARSSDAVMLCASAADLSHKFVGETEKAIKALFNLGRMLSPAIIFIDEADALFSSRSLDTHEFSRSRKNQLLGEMDGLVQSENPPFMLLATNFPSHLDHAVLRRVPSVLHIGLPDARARKKILEICLRDEEVSGDVDVEVLARRTEGYSGSDIRTLCVQAALACDMVVMDMEGGERRRKLNNKHFQKALQRSAPTVSSMALEEIAAFAKEHDPGAVERWNSGEEESGYIEFAERHNFPTRMVPDELPEARIFGDIVAVDGMD